MELTAARLRSRLAPIGATLTRTCTSAGAWLDKHFSTDRQLVMLILALALLVRIPFIAYPDRTLFDEVIYENFTIFMTDHKTYFDIHPPLARMIFAGIADNYDIRYIESPPETGQPFADFPYATLRLFNALLGTLLPLVMYLIARLLTYSPRMSALVALFVVFDSSFVVYSRAVLPDTLMFVGNMIGFAATLSALKTRGKTALAYAALAGLSLGAAVSIKWTALGVVLTAGLAFLLYRRLKEALIILVLVPVIYISVFVVYFSWLPEGGQPTPFLYRSAQDYIFSLRFPDAGLSDRLAFLPRLHSAMLETNRDPNILRATMEAPGPFSWPLAQSAVSFWANEDQSKRVILQGNSFLWLFLFIGICFEVGWILFHILKSIRRQLSRVTARTENAGGWDDRFIGAIGIDRKEAILVAGYALNFLPFFLIHRPMFLYHYMTALLFLFLLTPRVAPRMISCFASVTGDRLLAHTLSIAILVLALVNFFLTSPDTYGF